MLFVKKEVDCIKRYKEGPHQETVQHLRTGLSRTAFSQWNSCSNEQHVIFVLFMEFIKVLLLLVKQS
jgi:hypothetical protein